MAKRRRKDGTDPQPYEGQSRRHEAVRNRIRDVMLLLGHCPCLSVGEVAKHMRWDLHVADYTLKAAWSGGLLARTRAGDIEGVGGIGMSSDAWLYERVSGVRVLRAVA